MEGPAWAPSQDRYGVVICNYTGGQDGVLSLYTGDTVHILEKYGSGTDAWYRGCCNKNKNKLGIFPACIIHIRPCVVQNEGLHETITPVEDLMIREINYVIWEWHEMWKKLYLLGSSLLERIRESLDELILLRSQLLGDRLSCAEATDLRKDIVSVIDWGNGKLGLDLVPRIDGEQVDADKCSICQLYRVHVNSAAIAEEDKPKRQHRKTAKSSKGEMVSESGLITHHLLVGFKAFGCNVGDPSETLLSLYQYKDGKLVCLTERFLVRHSKQGMPEDNDKVDHYFGLFTDLSSDELEKEIFLVAHIYRIGHIKQESSKKLPKPAFKRPWGVGVTPLNLSKLPANFKEFEFQLKVQCSESDSQFTTLHEQIITKLQQGLAISSSQSTTKLGLVLTVTVQVLHGDLATVKKEDPMLFSKGVAQIQKIGFSDVITPGEVRNDFYVTLKAADLERGNKTTEVKVTVVNEAGVQIQECIVAGCGEAAESEFISSVYYHSNKPEWNETLRISIPIDMFQGSHVCFEVIQCSSSTTTRKEYGFAYIKVTNQSQIVIKDDTHTLCLYRVDEKKPPERDQYFKLPFLLDDLNDPNLIASIPSNLRFKANERESLTISTLLCSGKFTQNGDLPSILNWRGEEFQGKLGENLDKLCIMPGDEIVKFLHNILDALFDMLVDEEAMRMWSQKIFKALINIFTLIHHARFETFKPVFESYITDTFSATLVHKQLASCFGEMIKSACEDDRKTNMQLIQCFQVMDYIFKFIIQSRQLQQKDVYSQSRGSDQEFQENMRWLFEAMGTLLSSSKEKLQSYQQYILKCLHLAYDPLLEVLSDKDVVGLLQISLQNMPAVTVIPEDITQVKLELLQKSVAMELFMNDESRAILLPLCLAEVKCCLQEKVLVKRSINLLSDIMEQVFKLKQNSSIREDIKNIVETMFDVVMETIIHIRTSTTKVPLITCLTEILRLMEDEHYQALLHVYHRGQTLRGFLIQILEVFKVLVKPHIFQPDWTVMRMATNNVVFTAMEYFSNALKENFMHGAKFDLVLWMLYFSLAVAFITQPSLQLDKYSEVKAQQLRHRYQDMRVLMGMQVQNLWQSLGRHREHFIPHLIGPFLELTLVPEEEVRKATLPIIGDMMEWDQRNNGNFKQVEATLIQKLDVFLTQQHLGDDKYKALFKTILLERVQSEPSLQENGTQFIISVTHLLERLLDYRQVVDGDENKDKRMHCTFNILNFYKDEINREEMYIRYVNKLHSLHLVANNHAEAGLTLQLYAKVLNWSDTMLSEEMGYKQERESERKEMLYAQIINCFDKGKVWEYAIPLCKDLAVHYERNLNYKKLGDILKQQASFYQKILDGVSGEDPDEPEAVFARQNPVYYRVAYYGQKFPTFVRNKQFIYRGDECLVLQTIINHLTAEFPQAQILPNNNPPNEAIKDGDTQYIQICPVKPIAEERAEFKGKDVALEIQNFYSANEIDTFQFDMPYHRGKKDPENESKTLCVERTKMKTAYKFPGILRWYEVIEVEVEMLCPIRVAIETLKQYNGELPLLISRTQMNPKFYFKQLEMRLQGVISAAVSGGIDKYYEAFFTAEFEREHSDEVRYLEQLSSLLRTQVKILAQGLKVHEKLVPSLLLPLHNSLAEEFKKMKRTVEKNSSSHSSTGSLMSPSPDHRFSVASSSTGSGRSSTYSQEEESTLPQDMPFNFNPPVDKSRRSYVPFPEDGNLGNHPPPVPSRPQSMLLSGNSMQQVATSLMKDKRSESDPALRDFKKGAGQFTSHTGHSVHSGHGGHSGHSGHHAHRASVLPQRTESSKSYRPVPALPTRRPSDSDLYEAPSVPSYTGSTSPIADLKIKEEGEAVELPPKNHVHHDHNVSHMNGSTGNSHVDGPAVPPLPPRRQVSSPPTPKVGTNPRVGSSQSESSAGAGNPPSYGAVSPPTYGSSSANSNATRDSNISHTSASYSNSIQGSHSSVRTSSGEDPPPIPRRTSERPTIIKAPKPSPGPKPVLSPKGLNITQKDFDNSDSTDL